MRQQADPRSVAGDKVRAGTLRDVLAGVVLAAGWMCATTTWSWLPLVSVTLVLVLTLSVTVAVLTEATLGPVRIVALATTSSLWIIGATAMLGVLGWAGVLALVAVAASSTTARTLMPHVLRRRTTRSRTTSPPAWTPPWTPPRTPSVASVIPEPDVVVLDDEELCLAWRRSYVRLRGTASTATRLAIVRKRQEYLDELQLRHGEAFARWLATTTCASSDPLPFIRRESRRRRRRRSSRR